MVSTVVEAMGPLGGASVGALWAGRRGLEGGGGGERGRRAQGEGLCRMGGGASPHAIALHRCVCVQYCVHVAGWWGLWVGFDD